ncbi:DUF6082 family protein [Streptomyces sp. TP-A0356]|uniref:DUF6082 family protein n=1 Tax=Streptomyces sp. TP-A0356 TaxID=1359208 RepID=UPI0006E1A56C|nr:DUF6082 family protein [Streptomyces sp. TP-A0356]
MVTQRLGIRVWGSAAMAGLAFAAGALTVLATQHRRRTDPPRQAAEAEDADSFRAYHRLQLSLLGKALEDPELAAVVSTIEAASPTRRRQYLFANAWYANALFAYRAGVVNLEELHGHLRVLVRNVVFREYWDATRHHRASLKAESMEARVGATMDALIHDLDEADSEEWWVVGEPPPEEDPPQGQR